MSYEQDQHDSAHKRGIFETRELCRNLFYRLPPDLNNDSSINPPASQITLTRAILEYHSDIAVKRSVLNGKWNADEPLDVVRTLPPKATATVPMEHIGPDGGVNREFEPLQTVQMAEKTVHLSTLQQEWGINNQSTVRIRPETDPSKTLATKRYTLALPPRSARMVKAALDDCLEELGWTEDATEKDEHAAPI